MNVIETVNCLSNTNEGWIADECDKCKILSARVAFRQQRALIFILG